MIVGRNIDTLDIPHEPGNRIKIRELSGLELDDAQEAKTGKVMRRMASYGSETMELIRAGRPADLDIQAPTEKNPEDDYDMEFVIVKGIVDWEGPNYTDIPCDTENKKQLDKKTMEWIFKELVSRNTIPMGESQTSGVS